MRRNRRHHARVAVAWGLSAALVTFVWPVRADDAGPRLTECSRIRDDARRLACYDRIAGRTTGAPPAGWRVRTAERDEPGLELSVRADRDARGRDSVFRPELVLACREGKLEAYVRTGMEAQEEHGGPGKTVMLRFDDGDAFSERLPQSAGKDSLHFDAPLMVASRLLEHDSLYFQFMPRMSRPASVLFDARGLGEAIAPLLDACDLALGADGILEPRR